MLKRLLEMIGHYTNVNRGIYDWASSSLYNEDSTCINTLVIADPVSELLWSLLNCQGDSGIVYNEDSTCINMLVTADEMSRITTPVAWHHTLS